jgi:hypothetical protein
LSSGSGARLVKHAVGPDGETKDFRSHMPGGVFHTSSSGLIGLKTPRDRVMLSARASREMEKLPPPPVGRTMGHG